MAHKSYNTNEKVTGVILAGGKGSRMNGEDKGLINFRGEPLYRHVLARLQPQVAEVMLSANRNGECYQESGCRVLTDSFPGFAGPLAGMLAALQHITTDWAVFASCDAPFLPLDLVAQLWNGKSGAKAAWACSNGRDHPTHAIIHRDRAEMLEHYLQRGDRKLMFFLKEAGGIAVHFDDPEAFININTPEDLLLNRSRIPD
ncbi:molybdenum cofactor guanylyltransferase MobA [Erwinia sp. MMLR14_017]|uniref:molybdenum cofactor guanylyltransferase MobA n=1 Tax=Erwinia sp. MMLR14_017 TaxID=3093842 RepID=UPI0029900F77|nr:molybdenum cofactor guanylyltransferase MobA [Erwinia sp. MMLR14_017]MDW8847822.1 molybdenum cofactor guanylyltransferase MobA [Erwinia sp. MMLR14_017]